MQMVAWGYFARRGDPRFDEPVESLGSMTCSGLLGLAAGQGSAREVSVRGRDRAPTPDPLSEPHVRAGLRFLGKMINNAGGAEPVPLYMRAEGGFCITFFGRWSGSG